MALPTNVGKGTVRGKFIDSSGAPIDGVVTFKPTPKRLTNATATPRPVTILPKPVSVPLVNGEFETSDLIATTDPDNSPVGWEYRVEFQFAGGASAEPFFITLPEGAVVDLATVTPVASTGGVQITRGPGVPAFEGVPDGQVLVLVDGQPTWGESGSGVSSWNDLADKPTTFPPATHVHDASVITNLAEFVRDTMGTALVPGTGVTITPNDAGDTITVSATAGASNYRYFVAGAWQPRGGSSTPLTFDAGLANPVPMPTDIQPGDHIISLADPVI